MSDSTVSLLFCAFTIGLDKGGIPGISALGMAISLSVSRNTSITLALFVPVLFMADIGAVISYRKFVSWSALKPLIAPTLLGILTGMCLLGVLADKYTKRLSGVALLLLSVIFFVNKGVKSILPLESTDEHARKGFYSILLNKCAIYKTPIFGLMIGLFTVVANVAGPIAVVYFLQLGLPKLQLNGTRAWFFVFVNCIKIPGQLYLGNLKMSQAKILFPLILIAVCTTVFTASCIVPRIDQKLFERLSWGFVFIGALKLILL